MKRFSLYFVLTILTGILAACGGNDSQESSSGMNSSDVKDLVHQYSIGELQAENASITSEYLMVTEEDGSDKTYLLPEDEFFVSIAPFENNTHPCTNHNLTSCQGELVNEEFEVSITDSTGETIINETMTTPKNGFIDLWLPRNGDYTVVIKKDGKVAESKLSTYKEDGTCVTTMQLL
ncbi:hypothetical protein Q73_15535 [Bacillus coahuilensis m2-6]|uniref:CueP family metal-binding protein n=1 Tax=Bacillus coahuilensis TaxID=408580 RepID=UPI0007504DD2|nr:CueP family metal-binding protein [Bacillus coahuilensis]KUP04450.1 hypothetical protein Q73_15535 [Bacillus coahuilensis m2-6]